MNNQDYLGLFLDESREHAQNLNTYLLELEKGTNKDHAINEIFRSAHTLKGMAQSMGFQNLGDLTHKLENVLDDIRHQKREADADVMDHLFSAVDYIENMLEQIATEGNDQIDVTGIIEKLLMTGAQGRTPVKPTGDANLETSSSAITGYDGFETHVIQQSIEEGFQVFRINVSLQKDCVLKAARAYMVFQSVEAFGEILHADPPVEQLEAEAFDLAFSMTLITKEALENVKAAIENVSEVDRVAIEKVENKTDEDKKGSTAKPDQKKAAPSAGKTMRVSLERMDKLMNLFEELVIEKGRLEQLAHQRKDQELLDAVERIARTSSDLQTIIQNLRMVPIEQVFNRFPRMVRSVAKELKKSINLEITGAETELDRTVIDEIGDPLVHLIRNSMDHGIEFPDVRRKLGKPEDGHIVLRAYHAGRHVMIEIQDDGAGIDREKIIKKALQKEWINEEEAQTLSDEQVFQFLFRTGFSTADKITDLSGRGVGLDVVKTKIESLGGSVSVASSLNKGSRFTIKLPLTLSITTAMLIQCRHEIYAVPLTSISETMLVKREAIMTAHQSEIIEYRGNIIPFYRLEQILGMPDDQKDKADWQVLIVHNGRQNVALAVDRITHQQDIVIKPLGGYFKDLQIYTGATILGDGHVALILDALHLFNQRGIG
ncbi:chemotaxis protein CheW [Camelliibacillus cellulosilyticus]|uniref:Chemotaxis protein CheA n=1 Tax=Camelliibacillus cellulosilyticus TaxID=2174486 RepID=A0ABV9GII6_9BACL